MTKDITHKDFKLLFEKVQLSGTFEDSKTFPDCTPTIPIHEIFNLFLEQYKKEEFSISDFVNKYFRKIESNTNNFVFDSSLKPQEHINRLWQFLEKSTPETLDGSTYLQLPHSFIVPGGRFQEIYYWDTYFTMLGLKESGEYDFIEKMVNNFAFLIDKYGFIPNGNRSYFLSRSQPPFFALMLKLLSEIKGMSILGEYALTLEKEYNFWMEGENQVSPNENHRRVVKLGNGVVLNRYWDDNPTPRPESFKEDVALAESSSRNPKELYLDLRAACESGWDFSSRWLENTDDLSSIQTTNLLPIDLNSLLWEVENTLSLAFKELGNEVKNNYYEQRALKRKAAINTYFWNEKAGFFFDYDLKKQTLSERFTLAGVFPLFFSITTEARAKSVSEVIKHKFLKIGGVQTTFIESGQQWDSPNGWAPLQWVTFIALKNYGLHDTATILRERWLALNNRIFQETGKFTEKYDVTNLTNAASGGEYPNQDGFGWTNGVYLTMLTFL